MAKNRIDSLNNTWKNYIFVWENLSVMKNKKFNSTISHVDMIYIDPPYNTKSDFSYDDKRDSKLWANFMKERLEASKKLLYESWVIFISIDDNEYATLKILCDNVFWKENFIWTFITQQSQRSNSKLINIVHEYILCYAKNKRKVKEFKVKRTEIPWDKEMINDIIKKVKKTFTLHWKKEALIQLNSLIKKYCLEKNITRLKNYNCIDNKWNIFFWKDLSTPWKPRTVDIPEINLHLDPLETRWRSSDRKFIQLYKDNRLSFKWNRPYEIHYLEESEDNVWSILNFYSRQWTNDLNKLWLRDLFDTPKPVELIKFLIRIWMPKNWICLDFFAWSWTTAQAVYELNLEDWGSRNYVLIQLDENVKWNSKVYSTCKKFWIKPLVSEILIYRIKIFLEKNFLNDNNLDIINI